jgi:hypothetical protein
MQFLSLFRGNIDYAKVPQCYVYKYIFYFINLTEVSLTLTVVFLCFFLSCKANARVKTLKDGARPALFHIICYLGCSIVIVLFCVLFVCKCVLTPGDNPTAVNKYIVIIITLSDFLLSYLAVNFSLMTLGTLDLGDINHAENT